MKHLFFSADIIKPSDFQPFPSLFTIQSYTIKLSTTPFFSLNVLFVLIQMSHYSLMSFHVDFKLSVNIYISKNKEILKVEGERKHKRQAASIPSSRGRSVTHPQLYFSGIQTQLISTGRQLHLSRSWRDLDSLPAASCRFGADLGSAHPAWQVGSFCGICLS